MRREASEDCGVRLDCTVESDALLCTFAGIWRADGKPRFEFVKVSAGLPAKKIFFTDLDQVWYQKGIRALGTTIPETMQAIKSLIAEQKVSRTVMIGNSAGGYAAILFGVMTNADVVHAFCPQTELILEGYAPFPEKLPAVHRAAGSEGAYLRLREVLEQTESATHIYIHYSKYARKDRHHAVQLKGVPNVNLVSYPCLSHTLVRLLRDRGILHEVLTGALHGTSGDVQVAAQNTHDLFWESLGTGMQVKMIKAYNRLMQRS